MPVSDTKSPETQHYITKDMMIGEVVAKYPHAALVMMQYGLHCIGCHVSAYESVEQGALGHGMPPEIIDEMVAEMNKMIAESEQGKQ